MRALDLGLIVSLREHNICWVDCLAKLTAYDLYGLFGTCLSLLIQVLGFYRRVLHR